MSHADATPAAPAVRGGHGEHGAAPHGGGHEPGGLSYDPTASRIGMWLFLFTEVLLFGALFIAYAVFLNHYTWEFSDGSHSLNKLLGGANTVILLTSSLTMALSIAGVHRGDKRFALRMIDATLACAFAFLVIKSFEWGAKFEHHLYPGSAWLKDLVRGEQVYFGLYYTMTGLHALHVIVGIGVILWARATVVSGKTHAGRPVLLENIGLYWHIVDLIWIFLFPLFYLLPA
jgi:cytochrome c oxidase subunit 3